jgi:hypothetical protein
VALVAALLVVAAMLAPSVARATGTLTVWGGSLPSGTAVASGPWRGLNDGSTTGGPFGVRMPFGARLGWSQTASLDAPGGLAFSSVSADRSFDTPTSADTAQPQITTTWEARGWPYNGTSPYGGYVPASGTGTVTASSPGGLAITVTCTTFGAGGGSCATGAYWSATRMTYVLIDSASPTGALVAGGGELMDGSWHATATAELTLSGGDGESGLYRAFVREGTATFYANLLPGDSTCRDARPGSGSDYEFAATVTGLAPCPRATDAYAPTIDLAAIGDGSHTVDIGVEDASGREKILASNRTLKINAPGGALGDPGTTGPGGCVYAADGTCIAPPTNTLAPAIAGTPRRGIALVADRGGWDNAAGAQWAHQWQRCASSNDASTCAPIAGATSTTYTPVLADVDHYLRIAVTATSTNGAAAPITAYSPISAKVLASTDPPISGASGTVIDIPAISATVTASAPTPAPAGMAATGAPQDRCNGQRCPDDVALVAAFERSGTDALRIAYATSATVTGRLTDADGAPIAAAQVALDPVQLATGRAEVKPAVSGDDGAFTFVVPAGATSQVLRVTYRAHVGDATPTAVATLELKVRASSTLKVSVARGTRRVARNGDTVTFTGRVAGKIPVGGKTVFLQANSGHGWAQFGPSKTLKTDRHGAFAYRYRLGKTWGRVTYRFRVFVPAVDGGASVQFPYEDGYSKVRALTVRGYPLTAAAT